MCIIDSCGSQLQACLTAGGAELACNEVLLCYVTCGDQGCADECVSHGDREGEGLFGDFLGCVVDNCREPCTGGAGDCGMCIDANCARENMECGDDEPSR